MSDSELNLFQNASQWSLSLLQEKEDDSHLSFIASESLQSVPLSLFSVLIVWIKPVWQSEGHAQEG